MRSLITAVLMLAISCEMFGCAGPPPTSSVSLAHNGRYGEGLTIKRTGSIPALVVSGHHDLYMFDSSGQQIGIIPVRGDQGAVTIDKQGNIYYDSYNQYNGRVLIFAPPYTGKPKVISFANKGYAEGVTVDWDTGVVAVATDAYYPGPSLHSGVWFYRHGSTKPCAGIDNFSSSWYWAPIGSFDAQGTFFAAGSESSGFTIVSIAGECYAKSVTQYNPIISNLINMQFNTKNQLVIDEFAGYGNGPIVTYAHPANGQLGRVVSSTTLQEINGNPATLQALTTDGQHLWAATFASNGVVGLYPYPQGGAPTQQVNVPFVGDAAAYPPAVPSKR